MSKSEIKSGRYIFTLMLASAWAFAGRDINTFEDISFGVLRIILGFSILNIALYYLIDKR